MPAETRASYRTLALAGLSLVLAWGLLVIARLASHPLGANANMDPTSLPAYDAVARHLIRAPQ